jgi:tellurite resistance protein TerC
MILIWVLFVVMIVVFLAVDLGVFNRRAHVISTKEATAWTSVWVSFALLFSFAIYGLYRGELVENPTNLTPWRAAVTYVTGYLIELSLSIDNIFVIAVIFTAFNIPQKYQHRVLFWGILGAVVFRGLMILVGIALIHRIDWIIYVFGAFLLYTAYKMLSSGPESFEPRKSWTFKQIRRYVPISNHIDGQKFFVQRKHIRAATPLFVALLLIEFTDILFALDSIPAILAITSDPFLVFSSNILAILGLRSMYFFLSNMLARFHYLKYSLVVILSFVGIKMILSHHIEINEFISLAVIASALVVGIGYSLLSSRSAAGSSPETEDD